MGKLMKDVPATRYSLLDRPTPELRKAELLRNFAEDAQPTSVPPAPEQHLVSPGSFPQTRSTAQELEAYLYRTYRR